MANEDMFNILHHKGEIKTTLRFHLMLVRMTVVKKTSNNKCLKGCKLKGTLIHLIVQPLQKSVWRFLKKLKIKLP
jgi:hypothetical protein